MTMRMNDKRLVLSPEGELPKLSPKVQRPQRTIAVTVPGRSVFFIVLPSLQARTCMQYPGTTSTNRRTALSQRAQAMLKATEMETESKEENNSSETEKENKNSLDERSITSTRYRLMNQNRPRMNRRPRIRNRMNEGLNKINKDYIKYIIFSDNAWLSKFPETNNSQEMTEEMMKQFDETMEQAENNHQAALESINNLSIPERRKLYLALIQAIIGRRKENDDDDDDDDDRDVTDDSTDNNISHTYNKNSDNVVNTTEHNSENRVNIGVTEDTARVKRFVESKSTSEMKSQLHSVHNMERSPPDTKSTAKHFVNKSVQNTDTLLNVQNRVQQNKSSDGFIRKTLDQNDTGEDYMEEVKMLMESVLDEDIADDSQHNISPRQLTQLPTNVKNDLLFKDDMKGFQELLEAEIAPFEKADQSQIRKDEKINFSTSSLRHNTKEKNNDNKIDKNIRKGLEQYNKALVSQCSDKELMVHNDSQKSNIKKKKDIQSVPMNSELSSQSLADKDETLADEINTAVKQNNIRYKRGELSKTGSFIENLSSGTFEEKNRQIYLYLKELAEEGERALKSLYEEIEETNDEQTKIPARELETIKGNISTILTLPNFLSTEFNESPTNNKNTNKRDTNIKSDVEPVSRNIESGTTKSFHTEDAVKFNFTENRQHQVQYDVKSENKLTKTAMSDNVTDLLPSSSPTIQQSKNDQEYISILPSVINNMNNNKINGTMNKYDTEEIIQTPLKTVNEGINKEQKNNKYDASESTTHVIHYSSGESEEEYNKTAKGGIIEEPKTTETNKATTKEENYSDYHNKFNVSEIQRLSILGKETINSGSNNASARKENSVIMKIGDMSTRRIIGKRDETDVLETDEENKSKGQNNENNNTNLDPMLHSSDIKEEDYVPDKAIKKRDDGSTINETQSITNNGTSLLSSVKNNLYSTDNQQNDLNIVNIKNNDLRTINKKLTLTNKTNYNNSVTTINTSDISTISKDKTLNNYNDTNMPATEGNNPAVTSEVTLPLQNNKQPKQDPVFVSQQRKNRIETFKKRLAEIRERLLNSSLNKRNILVKQKRNVDDFSGTDYILTPVSKYIALNEEEFSADSQVLKDQNDQRFLKLPDTDEITNTDYKDPMKVTDDDAERNKMQYLLNHNTRYADNFHTSNNLPIYRLVRLLTNSRQRTEQEQQDKCKIVCRDNNRHVSGSDRKLLIPVEDITTPDGMDIEDTDIYTMVPAVMSGKRFLRSTGNFQDKPDGDYSAVQKRKIKECEFEGTEDNVHEDKIGESNKDLYIKNINNDKGLESRKKRKVIPVLLIDSNDYMEDCDEIKNIRSKRSITPVRSTGNNNGLKQRRSQNKINFHYSPTENRSIRSNHAGTHKRDVKVRPGKLLNSRHKGRSNRLLNKPRIHKRSINQPQLNAENSIKTLMSTNHISNGSTSFGESGDDDDSLFGSMPHRAFMKTMNQKKTNSSNLARLYKLAKKYRNAKLKDDNIEIQNSLKSKILGGNKFRKLKVGHSSVEYKTKNKTGNYNKLIKMEKTDNLTDTNDDGKLKKNAVQVDLNSTDLVAYLIDRIQTLFGFLNILTNV